MTQIPYSHLPDGDFLEPAQLQRIHETALRLLREVGLEVASEEALTDLRRRSFRVEGERVFLEPAVVEERLAERRRRLEAKGPAITPERRPETGRLELHTGAYAHHVHDLESDTIVPYTSETLVEMTKLVDVLSERGVRSAVPGYPLDVPPPLQPIAQYRIGAMYSRHGLRPVDPISAASMPYVFEMAEALGHPVRTLPVYVFSPMRLAGESLAAALSHRQRLERIHVSNMPSVGGTAPVLPFAALALAAAEVVGGYVVLSEITGLEVSFGIGLHAFDLRFGTMVFGSPEAYLFGQLNFEINRFYGSGRGRGRGLAAAGIHSRANFPGPQAAAEKAALMTAGALIGAWRFTGAGILSVDEVFSAEQLLVDCDIRDQTERLIAGLDLGEGDHDWVEEVRQGIRGGFLGLDSTLDHYRQTYWHPRLFDRGFASPQGESRRKLADQARAMVAEYISRHEYEPEPAVRRAVERIWDSARQRLG